MLLAHLVSQLFVYNFIVFTAGRFDEVLHWLIWNFAKKTTGTSTSTTNATARAWYQTQRNLRLRLEPRFEHGLEPR